MRIVFAGSPQFAVPTLEKLAASDHKLIAVFTQPDRPSGRAQKLHPSPVKDAALRLGLTVYQPEKIKSNEAIALLAGLAPDVIVVVGYGQILSQDILDLPRYGCINLHGSLLPAYRGAAPIQWAVVNGEKRTGVTTMQMDAGLDTGPVLMKWETEIGSEENAVELGERMSGPGAQLVMETLEGLKSGTVKPEPQDEAMATRAPILTKEHGRIDWNKPAQTIFNQTRGLLPWPGAWTMFREQKLQVWKASAQEANHEAEYEKSQRPGELFVDKNKIFVCCGDGNFLRLLELQLEGKRRLVAEEFVRGARTHTGEML